MEAAYAVDAGRCFVICGFGDEEGFGGAFDFAVPAVDGFYFWDDVGAGREFFSDDGGGDGACFLE